MKRLQVTVNGKVYDVQVEELSDSAPISAPVPAPATTPSAAPAAKPAVPAPAPAAEPAVTASSGDAEIVAAPMPGTIMDIKVNVGDSVKNGDVLFVLEAMKMENDIVSPRDGVIVGIHAKKGDSVESGQSVISLN